MRRQSRRRNCAHQHQLLSPRKISLKPAISLKRLLPPFGFLAKCIKALTLNHAALPSKLQIPFKKGRKVYSSIRQLSLLYLTCPCPSAASYLIALNELQFTSQSHVFPLTQLLVRFDSSSYSHFRFSSFVPVIPDSKDEKEFFRDCSYVSARHRDGSPPHPSRDGVLLRIPGSDSQFAAWSDYYGFPSHPLSIYRSGDPWPRPTGPEAHRVPKEARPVCSHPIAAVWYKLGRQIYEYFDSIDLR
jgi:hypothetical protein